MKVSEKYHYLRNLKLVTTSTQEMIRQFLPPRGTRVIPFSNAL
jgi:hypothetical protein